jgi:hypothetical protein
MATIPNAAIGEDFGGTGITSAGAGQLVLAGPSGNWWLVSSADGSVIDSGSNGLNMFGLTRGVNGIPNDLNCEAASANKKGNGKSATKITCYPEMESGMSAFWTTARCHDKPRNQKCRPTSCGALYLNDGAAAYEVDEFGDLLYPPIAESNRLCLAAVEDLNGGGLVYDGTGDEDNDGALDYEEACVIGTDPCLADTDGDGFPDGVDACPLEGPYDPDAGEYLDATGCIQQSECTPAGQPICDDTGDDACFCFAVNPEGTAGLCTDNWFCAGTTTCVDDPWVCDSLGRICQYNTNCGPAACGPVECTGEIQSSGPMSLDPLAPHQTAAGL